MERDGEREREREREKKKKNGTQGLFLAQKSTPRPSLTTLDGGKRDAGMEVDRQTGRLTVSIQGGGQARQPQAGRKRQEGTKTGDLEDDGRGASPLSTAAAPPH